MYARQELSGIGKVARTFTFDFSVDLCVDVGKNVFLFDMYCGQLATESK